MFQIKLSTPKITEPKSSITPLSQDRPPSALLATLYVVGDGSPHRRNPTGRSPS